MQSMKTSAALLLACQTVNAISLERVKQLSVRRGNDLYSMEAMINEKMEIQPQDQIIDAESGTITVIPGAAAPKKRFFDTRQRCLFPTHFNIYHRFYRNRKHT
jgi:hypothetical protein